MVPPERLAWVSRWPAQRHLYHLYIYERITVDYAAFWQADGTPLTEAQGAEHEHLLTGQAAGWQKAQRGGDDGRMALPIGRNCWRTPGPRAEYWEAAPSPIGTTRICTLSRRKCWQHTLEHTTTLLQLALFWDGG